MKSNGNNVMKVLKYIVLMTLLSYGTAVLGVAVTGATLLLFELLGVFLAGFALPIIGILGIEKIKFLRERIWIFIPVSILDALICYLSTEWLIINLLHHGSEYSWWGFQLIWHGKILIVNGIFLLIILLICSIKNDIKVDAVKSTEGEEI
ncbi:MAG: hypothetical protein IKK33_05800 [Lachnospiraceae bacterium]|nr:hypothetical protein [Lachnospiraceae bacterium]